MKLRKFTTISFTALLLAGLGIVANNNQDIHASQPVRVFKQTNGRNNRCYYGYYYMNKSPRIHYQAGILPKYFRKRGKYVSVYDPAIRNESPVKRNHSKYYIDDLDNQHQSHGKYYDEILINTRDVNGISNRQDRNLTKSLKSQVKRNKRNIRKHRHNHKFVNSLRNRNSTLQIELNTDNTNDRMRMDPIHKHKAHTKYGHKRNKHIRRNYTKRNKRSYVKRHREQTHRKYVKRNKLVRKHKSVRHNVVHHQSLSEMRQQTLQLVNEDRAETTGNAPLREDPELDQIAQIRAEQASTPAEENSSDPHDDPANNQAYYVEDADQLGYHDLDNNYSGENLAWGSDTAKGFNDQWFTKERASRGGHYRNIVGDNMTPAPPHFTRIGFGYYKGTGAEDFAGNDDTSDNNVDNTTSATTGSNNNNSSSSESDNSESLAQLHQQYEQNQKQVALLNAKNALKNDEEELNYLSGQDYDTEAHRQESVSSFQNRVNQDKEALQKAELSINN